MKKNLFVVVGVIITLALVGCGGKPATEQSGSASETAESSSNSTQATMLVAADGTFNNIPLSTTEEGIETLVKGYTWRDVTSPEGKVTTRRYYSEIPTGHVAEDDKASCTIAYAFNQDSWDGVYETGLLSGWSLIYSYKGGASSDSLKQSWIETLTEYFGKPTEDEYGWYEWERTNYTITLINTANADAPDDFTLSATYFHKANG